MRTLVAVVLAVILSLVGFGFYHWRGNVFEGDTLETKDAAPRRIILPELSFQDLEGREVKLSQFKGVPLVVNAWATWCPFCKEELRDFVTLQERFPGGVVVIAVNRGESTSEVRKYSEDLGILGKVQSLIDSKDSLYKAIGGFSMPETVFVDKDGLIVFHKRGPMAFEEMKRRAEDLLGL